MAVAREKLSRAEQLWLPWLQEHVFRDDEGPGCIELHHVTPSGSTVLERWEITDRSEWDKAKFRELIQKAEKLAVEDSEGMQGNNAYCLALSAGPNRVIDLRSPAWNLAVKATSIEPSESPTERGATQMVMRHLEQRERMMVTLLQPAMTHSERVIAALQAEVEAYREKHWQFMREREEFLDRAEERRQANVRAENEAALRYETLRTMLPLVPAVVNRFMGKQVLPETTLPIIELAKQVMLMFSAKDWDKLATVFADDPEKILPLMELATQLRKLHESQEAQAAKLAGKKELNGQAAAE